MSIKNIGCVIAYRKGHTNYGTSLVGYALIKKLQALGYNVEVINYVKQLSFSEKVAWIVNALRCDMGGIVMGRIKGKNDLKKNAEYAANIKVRTEAVEAYKERKFIPLFKDYRGYKALHDGSKNYAAVVVGSDQVWTPFSLPTKFFNLLFVDDSVRKVAYASSFGVSEIPAFQRKATGGYLDRFYRIGVREVKGKEIVDTLSHQKATVVADPTMLLSPEEWMEEIKDSKVKETEPYIFCYLLGTNMEAREAARQLKAATGYKIITLRHMDEYVPSDEQFGDEAPYAVDPNDFLKYISGATYVLTDSFHCSAFSIQFKRKFMTFYRFKSSSKGSRNSRIDSLLGTFGLQDRLYQGDILNIKNEIDYIKVHKALKEYREKSIDFLVQSLG
jgi:hypothetical protein